MQFERLFRNVTEFSLSVPRKENWLALSGARLFSIYIFQVFIGQLGGHITRKWAPGHTHLKGPLSFPNSKNHGVKWDVFVVVLVLCLFLIILCLLPDILCSFVSFESILSNLGLLVILGLFLLFLYLFVDILHLCLVHLPLRLSNIKC